ncbi:sugar ABC transporter ATP-binding protein [Mesorhizobium sp. B3-1-3]|uniref:sugar ABC transporter ATP-binding protein n=1 Tax=unclassified Mesorhizobium TaxID=325217 RepID=UPI00112B8BA8|nr:MULTISPECIES: sugar ABC transporter ATP-binding protein [unclassified Mesorhizobium]TPI65582.1 sugar ABC transporter ATP-binding protein [Mesorhizobium sp. B3-1-3]TPI67240.1 sugar ABC transporter ATP-binding protein [Mesorhizobium sp. B3-1-8]
MSDVLIEMRGVTKRYGGVAAIEAVDFTLRKGEIHALLGENGAGKSTLTKLMAGVVQPSAGEILLEGVPVSFTSPADAMRRGINMVYQENSLVPSMTVAQNIFLGDERFFNKLRPLYIAAQQFLQSLNFNVDPWANVAGLGVAKKQMVEIARAVRQQARVIVFDEPTASLTPEEKHYFFSLVRRLKSDGVSIVFISHALEEALELSDRITILRDGRLVISDDRATFDRERIVTAMVGRALSRDLYGEGERTRRRPGERVLSVQNLSMGKVVRNTSFTVYAGQVTGMFGLIGSGRTETAKIIAGIAKRNFLHGGETRLGDQSVRYRVPRQAVRDGIVYVTEDRKLEGFFDTMSIAQNVGVGHIAAGFNKGQVVRTSEIAAIARGWSEKLAIRSINADARVIELSGGNQQKVVIAKSLVQKPRIIIFDEPTRGVDVGAIAEIHQLIERLADDGLAVIVISSYLPEILGISDRILVCQKGRVVEEFRAEDATEEKIMYAAVH